MFFPHERFRLPGDGSGAHRRGRALRVAAAAVRRPRVICHASEHGRAITQLRRHDAHRRRPDDARPDSDLQRARQPARTGARRHRTSRLPRDGGRRPVARRHRRGRRRAGPRVPRPRRGAAPHRQEGPRPLLHRSAHAGAGPHRGLRLPDGRGPLARSQVPARDGGDGAARRPRRGHRLALPAGRQRGQLAAAPADPEHLRQPLHPRGDPDARRRLHQRLPLLAPRSAGQGAARADRLGRLRLPRRDALRGAPQRLLDRRGPDHLRRTARRPVEDVGRRDLRIGLHAVARGAAAGRRGGWSQAR